MDKMETGLRALVQFLFALLCVICFGNPAEAGEQKVSYGNERTLNVLGSLAQDPDAVACVRHVCLGVSYDDRVLRHQGLEACKHEHFKRIAWVLGSNANGPRLRSYRLTDSIPAPEELMCAMVTGQFEPSEELELDQAFLRKQEEELARLRAEQADALRRASAPTGQDEGDTGGPGVIPTSAKRPSDPSLRNFVLVEDELRRTSAVQPTGPDKQRVAGCAPEHVTVLESGKDSVKLYVDKGAAYDAIVRSCFSKDYRTDAVSVVEENYVEKTIPACILPDKRIELDPTRYAEILSGKRKLVLGGPPNLEFHKECQAKGGKPWVALQGRQVLYLAGKHKPRQVWPDSVNAQPGIASATGAAASHGPSAQPASPEPGVDASVAFAPSSALPGPDASVEPDPAPAQVDAAPCAPVEEGENPDAGLNLYLQPRYWDPHGFAPTWTQTVDSERGRDPPAGVTAPVGSIPGFWPYSGAGPPSP